jgi:hypothetical protein
MTDFRALCARMADELDYYRQLLMHDRRETHALAIEARAALAELQPPTFLDAIRLAKGSHDYSGGYGGTPCDEAFHAGIGTVVNVLTKAATGPWDYQTKGVFEAGAYQPAADGEVARLVAALREWQTVPLLEERRRAAELLERLYPQPIPVSERLPEAGDCDAEGRCWWWHPSHPESGYQEGWMLRPGDWGTGHYDSDDCLAHTHWLPAHALLLPSEEVR